MRKRFERRAGAAAPRPVDTLIFIGNGFDLWQGLRTGYDQFEAYYSAHLDEILQKLRIRKHELFHPDGSPALDERGNPIAYSDVELLYGDPFDPDETWLSHDFWNRFEDSLDKLDAQRLNLYFGKEYSDLKDMKRSAKNARRILRQAFCDWVASIRIEGGDPGYSFGDSCIFINFNYTDMLSKRFHVDGASEYHIHGSAADPDSIIFGHASHPEYPLPALYELGGRFRGLYFVEEILYETDKHVEDNYRAMCMFLAGRGVRVEDIRHIYVLGHSFGAADVGYFRRIIEATQGFAFDPEEHLTKEEREALDAMDSLEETHLNILHAMHAGYRSMGIAPNAYPPILEGDPESEALLRLEAAAVHRRFLREQAERDAQMDRLFAKALRRKFGRRGPRPGKAGAAPGAEAAPPLGPERCAPPQWRVSYYSEEDRSRIEAVLRELRCESFSLYPSIDECLAPFRAR